MVSIAVLMSAYNGEKYIREQIDSILNQEGNFKLKLIIRDDGSTDTTCDILDEYAEKGDVVWYRGENLRSAKSFIDLLYKNTGYDFYAFADQDDVWNPDKLKCGIDAIGNNNNPCLYFSNAVYVDEALQPMGGTTYHRELKYDFYSAILYPCYLGCTMVFNNSLAEIVQKANIPDVVQMHDSFLARVCVSVGGTITYDSATHILYRQHSDNVIGATVGKKDAIRRRLKDIFNADAIGIEAQINEILKLYIDRISDEKREFLNAVAGYKKSFGSRLHLAMDKRPSYMSKNIHITMFLKILNGNL